MYPVLRRGGALRRTVMQLKGRLHIDDRLLFVVSEYGLFGSL